MEPDAFPRLTVKRQELFIRLANNEHHTFVSLEYKIFYHRKVIADGICYDNGDDDSSKYGDSHKYNNNTNKTKTWLYKQQHKFQQSTHQWPQQQQQ